MRFRFPASRPGRRSPGASSSQARRRLAVESLEGRELLAVDFTSAVGFGSPTLTASALSVDAAGDSFVAGTFGGSLNLNPGPGVTTLTAAGNRDIYLAEYSKAGALLWAKSLPSTAGYYAQANAISLDSLGNIVMAGSFTGTANLNPGGLGGTLAATAGRTDAFVAKFNATGAFLWADKFEGTGIDQGNAVAVDSQGNALVTGSYVGATAFGTTTLTGTLTTPFVTKIDPAGNVLWAQGFGGTGYNAGMHIGVDAAGDAFVGGSYGGTMTVGSTTLSLPTGANSAFVAKLTPTGSVSWAVGFGGTLNTTSGGLAIDASGSVLVDGNFKSASTFGGIVPRPRGGLQRLRRQAGDRRRRPLGREVLGHGQHPGQQPRGRLAGLRLPGWCLPGDGQLQPRRRHGGQPDQRGHAGRLREQARRLGQLPLGEAGRRDGQRCVRGDRGADARRGADGRQVHRAVRLRGGGAPVGRQHEHVLRPHLDVCAAAAAGRRADQLHDGHRRRQPDARRQGCGHRRAREYLRDGLLPGPGQLQPLGHGGDAQQRREQRHLPGRVYAGGCPGLGQGPAHHGRRGAQGNGIALDAAGNIVITGSFTGTANLNPGGLGGTLAATGSRTDAFAAKFTPTGGFLWADRFEGTGADRGNAVTLDALGNALVTGSYVGATAFGATTLTGTLTTPFVTKIDPAGNVLWAQGFGGTGYNAGNQIAADAAGNAYVGGSFQNTINFNATTSLTSLGSNDVFVAKLDPTGALLWAKGFGGAATDSLGGLAVDASGNVYAAGTFGGPAKFGTFSMTPANGSASDVFAIKLDPTGAVTWAEQVGGGLSTFGTALALDSQANAYIGGEFSGQGNLNPQGGANFTSAGGLDAFVLKLDTKGVYQWALTGGGPSNDYVTALAVHAPDDLAAIGRYTGPATFGPNVLQSIDSTNMYVSRISVPSTPPVLGPADFLAASSVGGNIIDSRGVALDAAGNSYVTGTFNGTVDFDPGLGVTNLTSVGYKDVYLASYSPTGALLWAKDIAGSGYSQSQGNGIAVDANGNILLTGTFAGAINFNPGGSGGVLTSRGSYDAFVARFSPTGAFLWADQFGGILSDQGSGVAVDASGNVYASGNFSGVATFGTSTLASVGGNDDYVAKIDPSGNVLWATRFGSVGGEYGGRIAVDATATSSPRAATPTRPSPTSTRRARPPRSSATLRSPRSTC